MRDEKDVDVTEMGEENENGAKATAPTLVNIRLGKAVLQVGDVGSSVVSCRKLLNNKGYSCNTTNQTFDATLKEVVNKFQTAMGLTSDGRIGQATLAVLEDTQSATGWFQNGTIDIPAGKLARVGFLKLVLLPNNVKRLNEVCNQYHINTKKRVWHFLAQGLAETDHGNTFMEYGYTPGKGGNAGYSPFFGAGFLQLTGDTHYEAFQKYMKDVKGVYIKQITDPDVYATQYVADVYPYVSAGWFWDVFKKINKKISDSGGSSDLEVVTIVTKAVKGNATSQDFNTRLANYKKVKEIFK